ncbi:MAG: DUF167 domain-containing protein [Nanoarchaeota archaeon]
MIINVKTIPNSSISKIDKISEKNYKARIKSPPKNNKANMELINLLAKEFNVSAKLIKIKNPASKNKIIEIN